MRRLKRGSWYKLAVLLLVVPLLSACGIAQEEYDEVVAERDAAKAQVSSLQSDLNKDKSDLAATESALVTAETQIAELERTVVDPIRIDTGLVSGIVLGDVGNEVRVYRGIPYAAPPVEDLRWKPPQPAAPWSGIRECTQWSDSAAQGESTGSEDCLYLNVMTPAKKTTDRLPVMVWFHGGGLSSMTGNSPTYCHTALPQHGVVVVSVNHRLGAIGYMAHSALSAESEENASGNYGTLDLIAALHWVESNIVAFGGDPSNVTIFGESGGGTKVLSCMASPLAEGLFHRAIIESGSASSSPEGCATLEEAESMGEEVAAKLGVAGEEDVLDALRAISWEEILEAAGDVGYRSRLTVDDWVLPDTVYSIFQEGKQSDVPLIVGANEGEGFELSGNVPRLAASMSTVESKAYVYVFSHVPAGWKEEGCVAFHGIEIPYVFGYLDGLKAPTVIYLSRTGGATSFDPGIDEMDELVAENTMTIWSQFAATGDPSVEGLVTWPAYEAATDQYLDIGHTLEVKTGVSEAAVSPPDDEDETPVEPATYTNSDHRFSLEYPGNWAEKTEDLGPGVVWRVGQGSYLIPAVRVIIRDQAEGVTLQEVFTAHLTTDGDKTIDAFTVSEVTIDGTEFTQAEVTYSEIGRASCRERV